MKKLIAGLASFIVLAFGISALTESQYNAIKYGRVGTVVRDTNRTFNGGPVATATYITDYTRLKDCVMVQTFYDGHVSTITIPLGEF